MCMLNLNHKTKSITLNMWDVEAISWIMHFFITYLNDHYLCFMYVVCYFLQHQFDQIPPALSYVQDQQVSLLDQDHVWNSTIPEHNPVHQKEVPLSWMKVVMIPFKSALSAPTTVQLLHLQVSHVLPHLA